ncbi:MAG: hypothetical protein WAO71_06815 [Gallionella sp.]
MAYSLKKVEKLNARTLSVALQPKQTTGAAITAHCDRSKVRPYRA